LVLKLSIEDAIFLEDAMLKGINLGMTPGVRIGSGNISIMFDESENAIIAIPHRGLFVGIQGTKNYYKLLRVITEYLDNKT